MAGPELSRRLGVALGTRTVSVRERQIVFDAAGRDETWDDLPDSVKRLVEDIEARPGWVEEGR